MQNIRAIHGTELYYPFLQNHSGEYEYLSYHIDRILTYLLFVEHVILPPSFFLNKDTIFNNLHTIENNDKLKLFINSNKIITTSVNDGIRDFKDLQVKYSSLDFGNTFKSVDMKVYSRDVSIQKSEYANFMLNRIEKEDNIPH